MGGFKFAKPKFTLPCVVDHGRWEMLVLLTVLINQFQKARFLKLKNNFVNPRERY